MQLQSELNNNFEAEILPKTIRGRVKELRVDWGFIEGEDEKDYFLYCKAMNKDSCSFRSLKIGDIVEFVPTVAAKGPRAERVSRISSLTT